VLAHQFDGEFAPGLANLSRLRHAALLVVNRLGEIAERGEQRAKIFPIGAPAPF
jgi:hypothetical protein